MEGMYMFSILVDMSIKNSQELFSWINLNLRE